MEDVKAHNASKLLEMSLDDIIKNEKKNVQQKNKQKKVINYKQRQIQRQRKPVLQQRQFNQIRPNFLRKSFTTRTKQNVFKAQPAQKSVNTKPPVRSYTTQSALQKCRIWISGLHFNVINKDLNDMFSQIGPLKRCGIHWDQLGRSLGTAEVEFQNQEDAKKAISEYNNSKVDGQVIQVIYWRPGLKQAIIQI